ncbi:hypothetical protein JTY60_02260 [symbiont of Argiope bruennichi]|uniref:hypothetical protein n=1 Tax=symbiont of Argiope bruennichi TaxID=2810479 RepID=UPI003DA23FC7
MKNKCCKENKCKNEKLNQYNQINYFYLEKNHHICCKNLPEDKCCKTSDAVCDCE